MLCDWTGYAPGRLYSTNTSGGPIWLGLYTYDLADPAHPAFVSRLDLTSNSRFGNQVAATATHVFVAYSGGPEGTWLAAIDVRDAARPVVVGGTVLSAGGEPRA